MKSLIRKAIRKAGWDIVSYDPRFNFESRKDHLLKRMKISHVLDVGANVGQFGSYLRSKGFSGLITSFEPMKEAYSKLELVSKSDSKWTIFNLALGSAEGEAEINISRNSFSSSISEVLPRHLMFHPDSVTIAKESIKISTLDKIFDKIVSANSRVMLKVDTQGQESQVLAGAKASIEKVDLVILEMSLEPLYTGQELLPFFIQKMKDLGFSLAVLEPCDEDYVSFSILQMDGWFVRDLTNR